MGIYKGFTNNRGFTLVEMIVVMAIFIIIIIITTNAFDNIIRIGGQQTKTATGQIEGIVGLEMLQTDLAHAGYGLPWEFQMTPSAYNEVDAPPANNIGVDATILNNVNDSPPALPRAVVTAATNVSATNPGRHYLVIKSALLALKTGNSAVGRWGKVLYSAAGGVNTSSINLIGDNLTDLRDGTATSPDNVQDRVVTIRSAFSNLGGERKILVMDADGGSDNFSYKVPNGFQAPAGFQPTDETDTVVAYGISDTASIRMPYNRADYYISRPPNGDPNFKMPDYCNTGTGVLFKAVTDQAGGYGTNIYPLLNCVGDMRVVYNLDMDGDGDPQTFTDATTGGNSSTTEGSAASAADINSTMTNAALLRQRLKSLYVYILAHEGKKDTGYSYPFNDPNNVLVVGPPTMASTGRIWTATTMGNQFGTDWRNYRWKVYSIQVNMRNLQ